MKLLTKKFDLDSAQATKHYLESRGIPVHIGSENSGPSLGYITAADSYTLWVELDAQYQCALTTLDDEDYEVRNPINVDGYRKVEEESLKDFRRKFSKFNQYALNTIAITIVASFAIYILMHL